MIMNMIKASEVIEIFLKYGISNSKDESKYEISELDGITNTSYVVDLDNDKYVLRIPGDNPDVINRKSEKQNTLKAQEYGLTLPYIIFDENTHKTFAAKHHEKIAHPASSNLEIIIKIFQTVI